MGTGLVAGHRTTTAMEPHAAIDSQIVEGSVIDYTGGANGSDPALPVSLTAAPVNVKALCAPVASPANAAPSNSELAVVSASAPKVQLGDFIKERALKGQSLSDMLQEAMFGKLIRKIIHDSGTYDLATLKLMALQIEGQSTSYNMATIDSNIGTLVKDGNISGEVSGSVRNRPAAHALRIMNLACGEIAKPNATEVDIQTALKDMQTCLIKVRALTTPGS